MKVMDGLEGKDDDLYRIFDEVFIYIAKNDSLERLLGCNFQNVEDVFGLLDLEARVLPASSKTRDALLRLILETLARTIKPEGQQKTAIACDSLTDVAELESTPLEMLVSLVANRCNDKLPNLPCSNTIISLNYDTLVEQAMRSTGVLEPDYGTQELSDHFSVPPRARIRLLKLHGSMNWRTCSGCGKVRDVGLSASVTESENCCGTTMLPLIVPPSWDKGIYAPALRHIWQQAFASLKIARHWVFIGTSLPPTDNYLRNLFALALRHNLWLRHVTILDTGEAENIRKLFENRTSRIHVEPLRQEMRLALGAPSSPSPLFRHLQCFAQAKDRPFAW